MNEEKYFNPKNSAEIDQLLHQFNGKAHLLAGGTDLMVSVNQGRITPQRLIYIVDSGLDYIKVEEENIVLGATTSFTTILNSEVIKNKMPLLSAAVASIGSPAIRNVATIGGNIATASPAADSVLALLALKATLKLSSINQSRKILIEDFFAGPGQTVLNRNEFIEEIIIPTPSTFSRWNYRKLGKRKAQTLAVASVAIYLPMTDNNCGNVRIALGAVAPTPILAKSAMDLMKGQPLGESLIEQAARAALESTLPIDDVRGSAWYRRKVIGGLVNELLLEILNKKEAI